MQEVMQMGDRVILHSDINCCYASIEHLHHPELAGKPLAVGGDPEARHGIVLTADYIAKKYGVKTGMALWQAKQVCPDITFVSPRMDLYLRFSRMAHEIYAEYTDRQEPYGIDECWLDVTGSSSLKGDGLLIAQEISRRMKSELGITVSVGVSFNKIFAKLGSDYKKPDAITTMYKGEFKQKAWSLPVADASYKNLEKVMINPKRPNKNKGEACSLAYAKATGIPVFATDEMDLQPIIDKQLNTGIDDITCLRIVDIIKKAKSGEIDVARKVCKALWVISGKSKDIFDNELWPVIAE